MPNLFKNEISEFFLPLTMLAVGFVLLVIINYILVPSGTRLDIYLFTQVGPLLMVYTWLGALVIDAIRIVNSVPARVPGFIYSAHLLFSTIILLSFPYIESGLNVNIDNHIYVWLIFEIIAQLFIGRFLLFNVKISFETGVLLNILRILTGLMIFLVVDVSIALV